MTDADSGRALFCAVISQAVTDATSAPVLSDAPVKMKAGEELADYRERRARALKSRRDKYRQDCRIRDVARAWLTNNGADFREVCSHAGYEPAYVHRKALALAASDWREGKAA